MMSFDVYLYLFRLIELILTEADDHCMSWCIVVRAQLRDKVKVKGVDTYPEMSRQLYTICAICKVSNLCTHEDRRNRG